MEARSTGLSGANDRTYGFACQAPPPEGVRRHLTIGNRGRFEGRLRWAQE